MSAKWLVVPLVVIVLRTVAEFDWREGFSETFYERVFCTVLASAGTACLLYLCP